MSSLGSRQEFWDNPDRQYDLVVIGGGITGAGILREASRAGIKTLLVEAQDFAAGTSSRSAKLVHGGLRYLQNAQVRLTLESVRERDRLLREGTGLVSPLGFIFTSYRGDRLPGWVYGAGMAFYDLLARRWNHRRFSRVETLQCFPRLCQEGLVGWHQYYDAQVDDARLVLRVIQEAAATGGTAVNYASADQILQMEDGRVCGVRICDRTSKGVSRSVEVQSSAVINATGCWADNLRVHVGGKKRLRQLRGSHLVFPAQRFPLSQAICFSHPVDHRPLFAFPWEGVTLFGTTDVDHRIDDEPLPNEPAISSLELDYLMVALDHYFPELRLGEPDIQASFSGVRAVVNTGKANPSKESREHVLWDEHGLLTVTGGKLTTFRLMAHEALRRIRSRLPGKPDFNPRLRVLDHVEDNGLESEDFVEQYRLIGRYGRSAAELYKLACPGDLDPIPNTPYIWGELRWAAREEGVVHLDDLLLRRVRLGLLSTGGGLPFINRIREIAQPELGWDTGRWNKEVERYARIWHTSYSHPFSLSQDEVSQVSSYVGSLLGFENISGSV